ncbi:hypothetical protein H4Q26_003700 [Puccinia striiformis f. sp. tritici PST-130]|nr:hypothetical protein H4Q26_003700 [Puccinia striiformis f. sp. tritici PST-130]
MGAVSIHGTNPQFLIDKVLRSRIYDSEYWKESCFGLTAETIIDKTVFDLNYLGSTFTANLRPTPFICLLLKLYNFNLRRNHSRTLEPLLQDYRKLRVRGLDGTYDLTTFDEKVLEDLESLPERKSTLGIALGFHSDDSEQEQDQEEGEDRASPTSDHNSNRFVSRSPTPTKTDQDTDNLTSLIILRLPVLKVIDSSLDLLH